MSFCVIDTLVGLYPCFYLYMLHVKLTCTYPIPIFHLFSGNVIYWKLSAMVVPERIMWLRDWDKVKMSSNVVTSSGNAQEEVGISPVLLQAITHTLSSSGNASWMKKEQLHHSGSIQSGDGVHHLVIRAAPPDGSDAAVKVENGGEQVIEMESEQQAEVVNTREDGQETYIVLQQHDIDGKESQNLESIHIPSGMRVSSTTTGDGQPQVIHVGELPKTEMVGQPVQNGGVVVSDSGLMNSEMNMSGVLSAIASHLKNKKQQVKLEKSDTPIPISICPSEARVVSEDSTVTYRYSNGASVSSPGTDITVADIENVCQETVTVSDGVHMDDQTLQRMPIARMVDIPQEAGPGETMIILQGSDLEMSTLQLQQSIPWKTMQIVTSDQEVPPEMKGGCPICGDKISGLWKECVPSGLKCPISELVLKVSHRGDLNSPLILLRRLVRKHMFWMLCKFEFKQSMGWTENNFVGGNLLYCNWTFLSDRWFFSEMQCFPSDLENI